MRNPKATFFKAFCLLVALYLFAAPSATAQELISSRGRKITKRRGINLPSYDKRKLHYGFFLALNYGTFTYKPSQDWVTQVDRNLNNPDTTGNRRPSIFGVNPRGGYSFSVGFVAPNLRLNEDLDFRFLPGVGFYQRSMEYTYGRLGNPDSIVTQLSQATYSYIELPFLLKYKSRRRHNTRMYMVGGIKPAIEVGTKRKELPENLLRLNSTNFSLEYGFGFDFYYPLFKFSPELRFSHGVRNMMYPDSNPFTFTMTRLYTHSVTLYFHFE